MRYYSKTIYVDVSTGEKITKAESSNYYIIRKKKSYEKKYYYIGELREEYTEITWVNECEKKLLLFE